MQIKIITRPMTLKGRRYAPGEIVDVDRQTARTMVAIKRASDYETKPEPGAAGPVNAKPVRVRAKRQYNRRDITP